MTTFDRFVGNNGKQNVFVVKPADSSPSQAVLTRALMFVGQLSYSLLFFNCEHCEFERPLYHWRAAPCRCRVD